MGLQKYSDDALDALEFIFKNFLPTWALLLVSFIEEFSEVTHTQIRKQVVVERHPVPGGAVINSVATVFFVFHKVGSVGEN